MNTMTSITSMRRLASCLLVVVHLTTLTACQMFARETPMPEPPELPEERRINMNRPVTEARVPDRSSLTLDDLLSRARRALEHGGPDQWSEAASLLSVANFGAERIHPESLAAVARLEMDLGLLTYDNELAARGMANFERVLPRLRSIVYEDEATRIRMVAARIGVEPPSFARPNAFTRALALDRAGRGGSGAPPRVRLLMSRDGTPVSEVSERQMQTEAFAFLRAWILHGEADRELESLVTLATLMRTRGLEVRALHHAPSPRTQSAVAWALIQDALNPPSES